MPVTETEKTVETPEIPPAQVVAVAPPKVEAKPAPIVEQEEEEEEEDEDDAVDHPYDRLVTCIEIVEGQMKRLKTKQAHDLKAELTLNVYPIILNSLHAIAEYFEILDEGEDEEESVDPEQAKQIEEFQKMAEEEGRKILETCDLILAMDKVLDTKTRSKLPEQYDKILVWARERRDLANGQVPDSQLNATPTEPVPAVANEKV